MARPSHAVSNKGVPLEYDDYGYEYSEYHTTVDGDVLYKCENRGCKGKAHYVNGKLTEYAAHNPFHNPRDCAVEVRLVKQQVVEDRKHGVPTATAVQRNVLAADHHILPYIDPDNLAKSARRSVEVPGMLHWPATIDRDQFDHTFIRVDSCAKHPKGTPAAFKLMYSDFGLNLLRTQSDWSVDGTFYAAPVDFEQILVIGVQEGHLFTPCAYAFLTSKTKEAYENVFMWLRDKGHVNGPNNVTSDFEIGLTNGLLKAYPNASISRCAFHLYQNVYKKIKDLGLAHFYADNATKDCFKGIMALSMLPLADIPSYFDELKEEALYLVPHNMCPKVEELFDYFERNYIGVKGASGNRLTPIYPMNTWSVHARILAKRQIGNSTTEGFNSQLKSVPSGSSAQKVATILFEIDQFYENKHDYARLKNLTFEQAFPQSATTIKMQSSRLNAVANGAMGQQMLDHIKALNTHIHRF